MNTVVLKTDARRLLNATHAVRHAARARGRETTRVRLHACTLYTCVRYAYPEYGTQMGILNALLCNCM